MQVYSIDLEKVWLIGRPIVFIGALADVATESNADYKLSVRYSDFYAPDLRLQLLCAKEHVAPVLDSIKSDRKVHNPGGVVVAAQITNIAHMTEPEREGTKSVFIGFGRCTHIAYLGDAFDLMFLFPDAPKK